MDDKAYVYIFLGGGFVPAGLLEMRQEGAAVVSSFAYGRRYLERSDALALDPFQLPLGSGGYQTGGVFRAFDDASPDGWGRHLLDRAAEAEGRAPSEFDYLTVPGLEHRIGALGFGPDLDGPRPFTPSWRPSELPGETLDLGRMLRFIDAVEGGLAELPEIFRRFLVRGSSLGGAQPKAPVLFDGRPMIAKFSREREQWPTCRIELAALALAGRCGIRVPPCELVQVGGRDVFLVERFDREPGGVRRHFLSARTLTGADRMEVGGYRDIALAIRRFVGAQWLGSDLEELFRRMLFNILCNNWDDHLKNTGFLYDPAIRGWRLSPAYDIVPQPRREGGAFQRLTLEAGAHGTQASVENALSQPEVFGLGPAEAGAIADEVLATVKGHWRMENERAGVPESKVRLLEEAYRLAL